MTDNEWKLFLAPYEQAVSELKVKLKSIRQQYKENNLHTPIEFVTGRVKSVESIVTKTKIRKIDMNHIDSDLQDIAGLRIMCQFVEDIYEVVGLLRQRNDFKIVQERDYIANKKASGYRSYHLVIEYPVQLITGEKKILVEIQIRTLAMNFWATIEHSLNYKYQGEFPEEINTRLELTAEAAYLLDEEMSKIRDEIQEAQHLFTYRGPRKKQKSDSLENQEKEDGEVHDE
ncbi:GTP pyrophosphokinase family protein [Vagococcus carniphilus]|uniref:GTP pyrophosphokinase n=1 Tax=Vagococcus carniphilus TaxID=218144 RepID=UPI00288DC29A|nr:GTP pyrophosphokinase family protein [Vagococcus carniphilus]MDT2829931.1 GTP pyrophosphokinase family protein [Vagococcus carniphilus]MDT2838365.1 GTP pyrophosphokinase family protein [Vagococcus carniphilus]MDT2854361.1 GTP pyrophosphokinase family protein [Vagococcus carniphilus]